MEQSCGEMPQVQEEEAEARRSLGKAVNCTTFKRNRGLEGRTSASGWRNQGRLLGNSGILHHSLSAMAGDWEGNPITEHVDICVQITSRLAPTRALY